MSSPDNGDVTDLLARWSDGDRGALESLTPLVYDELRKIAHGYLRRERDGHTLQPTALVNEAWIRMIRQDGPNFENRKRFFALAARIMRNVLVDYARGARSGKRAGARVTLSDTVAVTAAGLDQFLALDEALEKLARFSPRQAQVIEMRHFGGLNLDEISDLLGVSAATISREQHAAEAWLSRAISNG